MESAWKARSWDVSELSLSVLCVFLVLCPVHVVVFVFVLAASLSVPSKYPPFA